MGDARAVACATAPGSRVVAAAVHLAVLFHRVGWSGREPVTPMVCEVAETVPSYPVAETATLPKPSQRPLQAYHAGLLDLLTGVAVLILSAWMAIMHLSGVVGR